MLASQSAATVERAALGALNALTQQTSNYLNACQVGAPAAVMIPWINGLDGFAWNFQQFAPLADWLRRQGLPQVEQRLDFLLRDLNTARGIYVQMYQGMVQTEQAITQIWSAANSFGTQNILASTNYSKAVFDKWQQDMFDITENRCYDCHKLIGITGGGYCIDCARRRRLIW